MQEERGRQDVERSSDRVEEIDLRLLQRREAARKPARDHEQAQPALRPAPPGDQTGEDVRDGDPIEQRRPYGIDVDAQGNVYVGDLDRHDVQKFSPSGSYLARVMVGGQVRVVPVVIVR